MSKYALKFHQLSRYAPELVSSMRARMRKFAFGLSRDFIVECKTALLNKDMDISRLVVYMQQVKKEKKKKIEIVERQSKKFRFFYQGGGQ